MDGCAQDCYVLATACCNLSRKLKPKKPRPLPGCIGWVGGGMLIVCQMIVTRPTGGIKKSFQRVLDLP